MNIICWHNSSVLILGAWSYMSIETPIRSIWQNCTHPRLDPHDEIATSKTNLPLLANSNLSRSACLPHLTIHRDLVSEQHHNNDPDNESIHAYKRLANPTTHHHYHHHYWGGRHGVFQMFSARSTCSSRWFSSWCNTVQEVVVSDHEMQRASHILPIHLSLLLLIIYTYPYCPQSLKD